MLLVTCKTTGHLCAVRFFIGLAESGFYPGFQYIVGSWYRKDELGKRASIFLALGNIGSMVSGYIMAGDHKLNGVGGFYGWQWLFLICGIISLPIALLGYVIMPDMPETTRAWYLTADEVKLAERRMELEGRAKRAPFTKAKVKKILTSWHIWSFALLYTLFNNGNAGQTQPGFALWLKSEGYSVEHVNVYPTVMDGLGVISTIIFAWISDTVCRGERSPPIMASGVIKIIAYTGLTVWNISAPFKWACFMLCGAAGGISGLIFTWVQEICSDDNEKRALVSASMNEITYVFQAWLPLVIWQQVESPRYPKGFPSMLGMGIVLIAVSGVIDVLHKREKKVKTRLQEDDQVSSSEA
ncbi:Major facilitator superfamily transporter [Fusarium albosuccineum]|uniref:Major facilitator superfamily transporter n=1 Tax=Fusarium albosuccineum TaxID=1237068 RepID=A0A8H4L6D9_9HYPO|nr:Major facilitator superfamily transporter [Fusarium albosuccineum]